MNLLCDYNSFDIFLDLCGGSATKKYEYGYITMTTPVICYHCSNVIRSCQSTIISDNGNVHIECESEYATLNMIDEARDRIEKAIISGCIYNVGAFIGALNVINIYDPDEFRDIVRECEKKDIIPIIEEYIL